MSDIAAAPVLAAPTAGCGSCGQPPIVQWRRRATEAELAALVAAAEQQRADALAMADPDKPAPVFGPLPTAADTTIAVLACASHAIDLDHAARVHAADCGAPHPDHLPLCDCEAEPLPEPEPAGIPHVTLPTGWHVPVHAAS